MGCVFAIASPLTSIVSTNVIVIVVVNTNVIVIVVVSINVIVVVVVSTNVIVIVVVNINVIVVVVANTNVIVVVSIFPMRFSYYSQSGTMIRALSSGRILSAT